MITLFWLAAFALAWIKWKPKEKKKPPAPVTVGDVKRAEKKRKEAAKKERAAREMETAQATLNDLDLLMDAAQRRYYAATKDQDIEKAQRQIIALRRQIAAQVEKIEKAKYIVKYGG